MATEEHDPIKKEYLYAETADASLAADSAVSLNSIEDYKQEPDISAYQNDPTFKALLLDFQNANWEECLKKIDQILCVYSEDEYLLSFRQEVEIRIKLQKTSHEQHSKEKREQLKRLAFRIFVIALLGSVVFLLAMQAVKIYQANKLAQEAKLTAEALAAKYQSAENFRNSGRVEDALRLYTEIQQVSPSYKDIDQKIQLVKQAMAIDELYHQGSQAFSDSNKDKALEILSRVEELSPDYKDTRQLIEKITLERKVASLIKDIQSSYSLNDWAGVVQKYEALQDIDSSDVPELKDILFTSYRKLILEMAGRSDLSLKDIETVEKYYRKALTLIPQDKDYSSERDELQKVAVNLLASKYYLLGIDLLKSSNYSVVGVQEAVRVLTKANNIGSNSPAIADEIEKAQLFFKAYDDVLHHRWDAGIAGYEKLFRKEENYAGGRVKYFLYEAYIARGDLFLQDADFTNALADYQQAEKFAWGDQGNLLRLFQIEVRIASTLHKLGQDKDASDFYHNIFERLRQQNQFAGPEYQDLLNVLAQADLAYKQGSLTEVIRLYETALKQADKLYSQKTIGVLKGATLINIAFENGTTLQSLGAANHFGESMIISKDQKLVIPLILENGQ